MTRPFDPDLIAAESAPHAYTVTELNARARRTLERNFSSVWVVGEVSNLTKHGSGHLYFTLKDEESQISAVMWREAAAALPFEVEPGMAVLAFGDVTLYSRWGRYQLSIRTLEPKGEGALDLAFRQLRDKLESEGLFDESLKKPLPFLPARIALVTSRTGAAVRDMIKSIFDRFSRANVSVFPVPVQGQGASGKIAKALAALDHDGRFDVIVVGRGGGSLEDLWAFNEEVLARAIFASRTPVVSAVGHERDLTICDLVADARAMTPTEVGSLVVPDEEDLLRTLYLLRDGLVSGLRRRWETALKSLEYAWRRPVLQKPSMMLEPLLNRLDSAFEALGRNKDMLLRVKKEGLRLAAVALESMSPLAVLSRGYSVTRDACGKVLVSAKDTAPEETIETILAKGRIKSVVTDVYLPEGAPDGQEERNL